MNNSRGEEKITERTEKTTENANEVVISDTEMPRSKFPHMSSRTGQSGLLFAAEVQKKAAENANEQKTASNKAVIWKGHGNVNLLGARERIGWSTLMMMMMIPPGPLPKTYHGKLNDFLKFSEFFRPKHSGNHDDADDDDDDDSRFSHDIA